MMNPLDRSQIIIIQRLIKGWIVDKEIAIHFNCDNCLVVKEKSFDTRITLFNYPQLVHSRNFSRSDQVANMPELNWIDSDI